jgi:hypothetical protein
MLDALQCLSLVRARQRILKPRWTRHKIGSVWSSKCRGKGLDSRYAEEA